ncbi:hypothetical protein D3C75_1134410 [compost metagenome]
MDGICCPECGGPVFTNPFRKGDKQMAKEEVKGIEVGIQVDTTQLDESIKKANRLVQLLERVDELAAQASKSIRVEMRTSNGEFCIERSIEVGDISALTPEERHQLIDVVAGELTIEEDEQPSEPDNA